MAVHIAAGVVPTASGITSVSAQSVTLGAAHATLPRIDRVVLDRVTGTASVVAGTAAASPAAPAIPAGKLPCLKMLVPATATTVLNTNGTDERAPWLLGLGSAAFLVAGAAIGNVLQLGNVGGNPALGIVDASQVTGITAAQINGLATADLVARDQIAATNLRLMLATSISTGALVQGKQWELGSDEWSSGSSGYTYVSAAPSYYGSQSAATTGNTRASDGSPGSSWTYTDRAYSIPNSVTVTSLGIWSNATSGNGTLYIMERTSAGNYAVRASQAVTFTATGWIDVTLSSPYVVPASGTFYVGAWCNASVGVTSSGAFATYNGQASGSFSASETSGSMHVTRVTYTSGASNMTLLSPAVSVSAAPSYADLYFLYKDDSGSAVLGTDLTVELSGNGSVWVAATISSLIGAVGYDGTYSVLRARANVSGPSSGTSLRARLKTLNTKAQRVAAPALYAE